MRTKPVVTRHQANEDIDRAFEYYLHEGGSDVAVAFVDEYELAISHISRFPLTGSLRLEHAVGIEELRFWPFRTYPYLVFYINTEQAVEVWRVLHSSRDIPTVMRDQAE